MAWRLRRPRGVGQIRPFLIYYPRVITGVRALGWPRGWPGGHCLKMRGVGTGLVALSINVRGWPWPRSGNRFVLVMAVQMFEGCAQRRLSFQPALCTRMPMILAWLSLVLAGAGLHCLLFARDALRCHLASVMGSPFFAQVDCIPPSSPIKS